jgi:hypothetical protein
VALQTPLLISLSARDRLGDLDGIAENSEDNSDASA